jgi:cellulose synthase/poly-beta-1,6-N-acetylglucosamine synthase-like glycosyltransferase
MIWMELLVALCVGLVVYSYLGYPFVLSLVAAAVQFGRDARYVLRKVDRRQTAQPAQWPRVAIVISAYNEQTHLQQRIDNVLALDYPPDLLTCFIGSDGSKDRTNDILRACAHPVMRPIVYEVNRGKASVLNALVSETDAEILVFSDANTFFRTDALKQLVKHFEDPAVGGVSGELRLLGGKGDNQDGLYWRVEQFLKFFEARIGGLLGANGGIYAIRRALWRPLAPDTICDDFCVAMNVSAAGGRLIYEPVAIAEEHIPDTISEEFQRRTRIGIGNFQALMRHPEYLTRTSWGTVLAYVSHKVLRWVAPHLLLVGLGLSCVLATQSSLWVGLTLAQVLVYGSGALLYALTNRQVRLPGLLRIVAFLYALNWAFLVASWRYVRGDYRGSWHRSAR